MIQTYFRTACYRHAGDTHHMNATKVETFDKALATYRKAAKEFKAGSHDWPFMPILEEFDSSTGRWNQSIAGMRASYRLRMKDDQGKFFTPQDRGYFGTFEEESDAFKASCYTSRPSFVQAWDAWSGRWVKAKVPGSLSAA